jgi:putative membrane protein
MTLEGLLEFEAVRDFLYTRMRGYRDASRLATAAPAVGAADGTGGEALLREAVAELRATRLALEQQVKMRTERHDV